MDDGCQFFGKKDRDPMLKKDPNEIKSSLILEAKLSPKKKKKRKKERILALLF
jgi:hypothetical protein